MAALVLLLVLTVLAASAVVTATLELTMAGNSQSGALAFGAAETGIEVAIAGPFATDLAPTYADAVGSDGSASFVATVACAGVSAIPDGMYSETIAARAIHFEIESAGNGPRGAVAVHKQGVYVIGPAPAYPSLDLVGSAAC